MRKFYFILLLFPFFGFSQNACKKCSIFSANNNWSKLILCISDEIKKTENINDYMCRVQCFGAIFQKTDSITLEINSSKKYYSKKDILMLSIDDLDRIIQKDSLFANGIPFKQRQHIEKLLNEY
ncbi:hypothetical protein OA958_00605 [Bacteroidota bacterium]|nr:hypothetical protein [Bacteroidota bacterium]|tara:strand:- start:1862 stop:2233 length:372 start_codon:yes stop_codon:yes gene_type:complete